MSSHITPNEFDLGILAHNQSLAPPDGSPFHDPTHLAHFLSRPSNEYMPSPETLQKLAELDAVVSIMGAFAVGKNASKTEAIGISTHADYRSQFPHGVHEVVMGTTRLPEFRGHRVEDHTNYVFCFDKTNNQLLVDWLQNGELVQWAQPRGDHVYFSWIGSYPTAGVALLDTIPATLHDLDRVLQPSGKSAIGLYRTVATFDDWWERVIGRKDVLNRQGEVVNQENYDKRMKEAVSSLTEALDLRDRLVFFEADERREAGKLVLEIVSTISAGEEYSTEAQRTAIEGAHDMLKGLEERGFKAA